MQIHMNYLISKEETNSTIMEFGIPPFKGSRHLLPQKDAETGELRWQFDSDRTQGLCYSRCEPALLPDIRYLRCFRVEIFLTNEDRSDEMSFRRSRPPSTDDYTRNW